jgi:hypothetical protein
MPTLSNRSLQCRVRQQAFSSITKKRGDQTPSSERKIPMTRATTGDAQVLFDVMTLPVRSPLERAPDEDLGDLSKPFDEVGDLSAVSGVF